MPHDPPEAARLQRFARRAVALAATIIVVAGCAGSVAAQPSPADARRDMLFAWCAGVGVARPPRSETQMRALSPACAERSARIAADVPPPRPLTIDTDAAPPGPAELCARATAAAGVGAASGTCLTVPESARRAAPDLVAAFASAVPESEHVEETVRRALRRTLADALSADVRARLEAAGFACFAATCRLDLGFVQWRRRGARFDTETICSFAFAVRPTDRAFRDEDVSVVRLCL